MGKISNGMDLDCDENEARAFMVLILRVLGIVCRR